LKLTSEHKAWVETLIFKLTNMRIRHSELAPAAFLEAHSEFDPRLLHLLWQRNLKDKKEIENFLNPDFDSQIHDPFLFAQMRRATERVFEALEKNQVIFIHGDYDADGVTGTVVVYETLLMLKSALKSLSEIQISIPHREKEGYGLSHAAVESADKSGAKLLITVDCGVSSIAETNDAHERGIDVIVVDHHALPPKLSDYAIILHPDAPGETYPFKRLAAVGVAFKFACGLAALARERQLTVPSGFEKWLLDLVSIATVTDIVPLVGENRVLEKFGLVVLRKTKRHGFKAIFDSARLDPALIDARSIGFVIGPRINAAGRMRHAKLAFDALTATTPESAQKFAAELEEANRERQFETERMIEEALLVVKDDLSKPIICIAKKAWPHGLVGLVASRLVQEFGKPAYVVGITERGIVGSGRSVPGFHVTEALQAQGDFLHKFGGHPMACGFTVKDEISIAKLFAGLNDLAPALLRTDAIREFRVDLALSPAEATLKFVESLAQMEPFGEGNPKPSFCIHGGILIDPSQVGNNGNHFRFSLRDGSSKLSCIGFGLGAKAKDFKLGDRLDVIGELVVNEWNGKKEVQCRVKEIGIMEVEA